MVTYSLRCMGIITDSILTSLSLSKFLFFGIVIILCYLTYMLLYFNEFIIFYIYPRDPSCAINLALNNNQKDLGLLKYS